MTHPAPRRGLRPTSRLLPILAMVLASLASAQSPAADPGGAPGQLLLPKQLPSQHQRRIRQLEAACAGTPWQLQAVIQGLPAAYGSFADLNGDGRLDYLCTEMIHARETLSSWLQTDRGWRQVSRISRPFAGRHPLAVWVLPGAAENPPLVLLEVGWAPYLFAIPTDGRGRLLARRAFSLGRHLPARRSRQGGVDNNPYSIRRVQAGKGREPGRIFGRMQDRVGSGVRERWIEKQFEIRIRDGKVRGHRHGNYPRSPGDAWLTPAFGLPELRAAARDPRQEVAGTSPLRSAVMIRRALDVDGDGTLDLVAITCDFAAHVMFGKRGTQGASGLPQLLAEEVRPRTIPIRQARGMWATGDDAADQASFWREQHGIRLHQQPARPADLLLSFELGADLIRYRFDPARRRYTATLQTRDIPARPEHLPGARYRIATHRRWERIADFSGDGRLDALSLRVATDHRLPVDQRHPQGLLTWFEDRGQASAPQLLLAWDEPLQTVVHWTKGDPISLREVPVFDAQGHADPARTRFCLYLREHRLGVFLARRKSR